MCPTTLVNLIIVTIVMGLNIDLKPTAATTTCLAIQVVGAVEQ